MNATMKFILFFFYLGAEGTATGFFSRLKALSFNWKLISVSSLLVSIANTSLTDCLVDNSMSFFSSSTSRRNCKSMVKNYFMLHTIKYRSCRLLTIYYQQISLIMYYKVYYLFNRSGHLSVSLTRFVSYNTLCNLRSKV